MATDECSLRSSSGDLEVINIDKYISSIYGSNYTWDSGCPAGFDTVPYRGPGGYGLSFDTLPLGAGAQSRKIWLEFRYGPFEGRVRPHVGLRPHLGGQGPIMEYS